MKSISVPVANAQVGDEYVTVDEHKKSRKGIVRDIRWAGRYDRTQVIFSVKFPGEKNEKEFRHELLGTYEVPGIPVAESDAVDAVDAVAVIHAASQYLRDAA